MANIERIISDALDNGGKFVLNPREGSRKVHKYLGGVPGGGAVHAPHAPAHGEVSEDGGRKPNA